MEKIKTTIAIGIAMAFLFFPFSSPAAQSSSRERKIAIVDNGLHFQIQTGKILVAEILVDLEITLNPDDRVYPALSEEASDRIIIERATAITLAADNQIQSLFTFEKTVRQALSEAQISLNPNDEINYSLDAPLFSNMEINITRVKFDALIKNAAIPFETLTQKDDTLLWGKFKIVQTGKLGLKEQTYKIVYKNNKETKRILEKETILKKPQAKIILEGTKIVLGKPQIGIASFYRYGDKLTCASTRFSRGANLRVTNLENGKKIIVTVNDYGPFVPGRVIDLNVPAFEKIASLGAGLANVKVEEILN